MLTTRLLFCVTLLALCSVQFSDAWLWSWSRGRSTIRADVRGVPGVRRDWGVWVRWTYRFAKNDDVLNRCDRVANAIVTREQWNAVAPRQQLAISDRANRVFVWQTGADTCNLIGLAAEECRSCLRQQSCTEQVIRALQDVDLNQGMDDIKYNFLIGQDGVIYEGRGWDVIGQHTAGKNSQSIGIALIGDFSKAEPSQATQDALNSLIVCGKATDELTKDAPMTTGPDMAGQAFYAMLQRCNGLCVNN